MLYRLFSLVALLSAAHAAENPCTGKPAFTCEDSITSCAVVFPQGDGGVANDKCFDSTSGDFAITPLCRSTCQLCCQEPQYNCADDPIATVGCPDSPDNCNQFGDMNFLHCKSSCGWCQLTAKPCVDDIDSAICKNFKDADLCTNPEVYTQCEKTCKICIAADCADKSTRCPIWVANGFCTDPFYTADRETYCKESCDLC